MNLLEGLRGRDCPVCGAAEADSAPFLSASVDPAQIGRFSFASRKPPEFMSFRLVRCRACTTVYAAEAPSADTLAAAYAAAAYDTSEEADLAARTYALALSPHLGADIRAGAALEIGAGTGGFLRELQGLGFRDVVGIEPSHAAVAAAAPDLRHRIRVGVFDPADHAQGSYSFIGCFMTLEHVRDPQALTRSAFSLLAPGGVLALVTHDYRAPINRLLGRRSPIIDIEHMQLFCPGSLRRLLSGVGFSDPTITAIRNAYPLRYWMRLLPLPGAVKAACISGADAVGLGGLRISLNVGNLLTVARKPAGAHGGPGT
jgi:SAM-dependent methyltransferase